MINLPIHFVTIVLDGMPFIKHHLPEFEKLTARGIKWKWHVREGVSKPSHCTSWCRTIPPGMSKDGTHEYITGTLWRHPNCDVKGKNLWDGKVSMFNDALDRVNEPCILMQIDADAVCLVRTQFQQLITMALPTLGS